MGYPPPPPLYRLFFGIKRVTDLGGTPPPFTDKIRKVVFEVPPKIMLDFLGDDDDILITDFTQMKHEQGFQS